MDIFAALGGIGAALGLATSAGLNAYIPLLLVALAAHFPVGDPLVRLNAPYDLLANGWIIGLLVVLLVVEMLVDKVPAVDSINDIVQTFVRPAAGAFLFAANADVITDVSPVLAVVVGVLLAGGVHVTKGTVRPVVTATTAGTGNWLVSLLEDIVAFVLSLLAILIPLLAVVALIGLVWYVVRFFRRRRERKGAVGR